MRLRVRLRVRPFKIGCSRIKTTASASRSCPSGLPWRIAQTTADGHDALACAQTTPTARPRLCPGSRCCASWRLEISYRENVATSWSWAIDAGT